MQTRAAAIILLLAFLLPAGGCSHFSQTNRQQRAYEKYIRKSSVARNQQRSLFKNSTKSAMPSQPIPTETVETTETEQSPQAMSSEPLN